MSRYRKDLDPDNYESAYELEAEHRTRNRKLRAEREKRKELKKGRKAPKKQKHGNDEA